MKLANSDILEFQELYEQHVGVQLDWEEAAERANRLVQIMNVVYQPLRLDQFEMLLEQDKQYEDVNENRANNGNQLQ